MLLLLAALAVTLDGAGGARVVAIGFDDAGALHVTGTFFDALTAGGKTIKASGRGQQMFVATIGRDGKVAQLVRAGGELAEVYGMAVAPDGSVALVGGYDRKPHRHEGTVMLIGPNGKLRWERAITSTDRAFPSRVAFAPDGALYVCGGFANATTFGTQKVTSVMGPHVPSVDVFVARYTADGKLAWVATGGGPEDDGATAIAVLPSGDVAIAGHVGATPTFGAVALPGASASSKLADPSRGFVAIYSPAGELRTATQFGTHDFVIVDRIAALPDGTIVATADDEDIRDTNALHPTIARFDANAKLVASREVSSIDAALVDGTDVLTTRIDNGQLLIERHDGARTKLEVGIARASTTKLESVALARSRDGRFAFAAIAGDFVEHPLHDGRVEVSSDAIDSFVQIGALGELKAP